MSQVKKYRCIRIEKNEVVERDSQLYRDFNKMEHRLSYLQTACLGLWGFEVIEVEDNDFKKARKRIGLNLVQLSELSGVAITVLQKLERGGVKPGNYIIGKLSKALNVSAFEMRKWN